MPFQLSRGLAKFDYVDHHAILGVAVDAKVGEVRKRYLKIARSLHPDSCTEANKKLASQLLSKLVNPGYEKLTQDRERTEYEVLLRLLGQRIAQEKSNLELQSELAKQLFRAKDLDNFYRTAVQDLAEKQYQSLDQVIELTGELSELNLAYLVIKEGGDTGVSRKQPLTTGSTGAAPALDPLRGTASPRGVSSTPATSMGTPRAQGQPPVPSSASKGTPPPPPSETFVSQYYRRAEEFLAKNNLQQASLELKDALKLEPNNSRCHGLIGTIYLRQNQMTMAKVHFNQALKLDSKNSMALTGKEQLDKLDQKSSNAQKQGSGGLFGLFGGKKK